MKQLFLLIMTVLLVTGAAIAEPPSVLFEKANQAYKAQNYQSAASIYNDLIESDHVKTSSLFYNSGNANYKLGNTGQAILNYEKALLLKPRSSEIKENLSMSRAKTLDRIDSTVPFITAVILKLLSYFSINEIAWAFWLISMSFILMTFFILNTAHNYRVRTVYLYALLPAFVFMIIVFGLKYFIYEHSSKGIIITDKVEVKSGPAESFQTLFPIHEGLKFSYAPDAQGGWTRIELDNGNNGWIPAGAAGRINPL